MWWKVFVNRETAMLSSQKPRECACVVSDQLTADVVPIGFFWQRWLAVTRVTCVTNSCVTVGHWSLSHIKPCLNHIVVVSNQLWDQFDLSTPVTAVLSPYIKPCCDQSPEQGRHPNENISDVNFAKVQCQRQDRTVPRRGWWRRRCSSLHLLRKIFSLRPHQVRIEITPGEDWDHTRWKSWCYSAYHADHGSPGDLIDTSVAKGASGATDGEVIVFSSQLMAR